MPSHALFKRVWHDSIYNLRSNCSAKHYPARHSLSERSAVKNLGQRASATGKDKSQATAHSSKTDSSLRSEWRQWQTTNHPSIVQNKKKSDEIKISPEKFNQNNFYLYVILNILTIIPAVFVASPGLSPLEYIQIWELLSSAPICKSLDISW